MKVRSGKDKPTQQSDAPSDDRAVAGSSGVDHSPYNWIISELHHLNSDIGKLTEAINNLKTSVDGTNSKVENLVNWKNRIIGGAVAFGVVATFLGFFIGLWWNYVYIKSPTIQPQPVIQQPIIEPTTPQTNRNK